MKYLMIINLLLSAYVFGGCIAKTVDVQANSDLISANSDQSRKLAKLVNDFHKTDKTKAMYEEFKRISDASFDQKIKSKNFVSADQVKTGMKVVSSISGGLGIPMGGPIMDTIGTIISIIMGGKGISLMNEKRKKREFELADNEPKEAHKIRKGKS